RRSGALDVDDEERELERDREADRLGLQDDSRAGTRRAPAPPAEGGPAGRAARGDLILCLEGPHVEVLEMSELLEYARRRSDRIRAEEEREPGELAGGDPTLRERR